MNVKKSLCSAFLLAIVLGTAAPALVSANETTTQATTAVAPEATTTSEATTGLPAETTQTIDALTSTTEVSTTVDATTESESNTEDSETAALEKAGILEAIIGKDDQYRVKNTTVHPYRSVVYLQMTFGNQTYVGSGVMIAPNLVLTAGHNIYNRETGAWASSVIAVPGRNDNSSPFGTYSSSTYYTFRQFKTEGNVIPSNYDIAVVKLNKNVSSEVGYLPLAYDVSRGQRLQIPGFPAYTDSKFGKMYTAYGTVDGVNGHLIGHLIDAESGNSGSPILNSKNQIVGIHTAGNYTIRPYGNYNWGTRINSSVLGMISHSKKTNEGSLNIATNKETKTGKTYRLYNPGARRHLFTQNLDEAQVLTTRGWKFEGLSFRTVSKGAPVYRLYGKTMKEHLYTTSKAERDALVRTGDWNAEGIAFYSGGKKPVYRLYNPGLRIHLYSSDANEVKVLKTRGWKYEGITFYTQ